MSALLTPRNNTSPMPTFVSPIGIPEIVVSTTVPSRRRISTVSPIWKRAPCGSSSLPLTTTPRCLISNTFSTTNSRCMCLRPCLDLAQRGSPSTTVRLSATPRGLLRLADPAKDAAALGGEALAGQLARDHADHQLVEPLDVVVRQM